MASSPIEILVKPTQGELSHKLGCDNLYSIITQRQGHLNWLPEASGVRVMAGGTGPVLALLSIGSILPYTKCVVCGALYWVLGYYPQGFFPRGTFTVGGEIIGS